MCFIILALVNKLFSFFILDEYAVVQGNDPFDDDSPTTSFQHMPISSQTGHLKLGSKGSSSGFNNPNIYSSCTEPLLLLNNPDLIYNTNNLIHNNNFHLQSNVDAIRISSNSDFDSGGGVYDKITTPKNFG